jgi:hypothetical protein
MNLPELLQDSHIGPSLDLLPSEILSKVLNLLPRSLDYYLVSKRFFGLIGIYHKKAYAKRVLQRTGMASVIELHQMEMAWGRVCCTALACLYRNEWDTGAPRLFYIPPSISNGDSDLNIIRKMQSQYPNPESQEWRSILDCTMDYNSFFEQERTQGVDLGLLLRYSERMDIGTFHLFLSLPTGPHLFRCKPIGSQSTTDRHGSGRIVLWDASKFGTCSCCGKLLIRLQVCADCRVSQYCSKSCQQRDWEEHKPLCKELAFSPLLPLVEEDEEEEGDA